MYFYLQKPQKGVNLHVEKSQKGVNMGLEKSQKGVKRQLYEEEDLSATAWLEA